MRLGWIRVRYHISPTGAVYILTRGWGIGLGLGLVLDDRGIRCRNSVWGLD